MHISWDYQGEIGIGRRLLSRKIIVKYLVKLAYDIAGISHFFHLIFDESQKLILTQILIWLAMTPSAAIGSSQKVIRCHLFIKLCQVHKQCGIRRKKR